MYHSSVMLARPALLNCSIFKPDGHVLPLKEVNRLSTVHSYGEALAEIMRDCEGILHFSPPPSPNAFMQQEPDLP